MVTKSELTIGTVEKGASNKINERSLLGSYLVMIGDEKSKSRIWIVVGIPTHDELLNFLRKGNESGFETYKVTMREIPINGNRSLLFGDFLWEGLKFFNPERNIKEELAILVAELFSENKERESGRS